MDDPKVLWVICKRKATFQAVFYTFKRHKNIIKFISMSSRLAQNLEKFGKQDE